MKRLFLALALAAMCTPAWADYFPDKVVAPEVAAGRFVGIGPQSSVSTCGTGSPTVSGGSTAGTITTGSGATTACTLTFGTPFSAPPVCVFTDANNSVTPVAYSTSTTTASSVIVKFASAASAVINYVCLGK